MIISEKHYLELKNSELNRHIWVGRIPSRWYGFVIVKNYRNLLHIEGLPNHQVTRSFIFEMVKDRNISTLLCCITVLAWGGMRISHGRDLFNGDKEWISTCEAIRLGKLNRKEAYREFSNQRVAGQLAGMGPAYFTKLIFFLTPINSIGYIMDQWTAASINLIFQEKIVQTRITINKNNFLSERVLDTNKPNDYENFCLALEHVAEKLSLPPQTAEEMMFSSGGKCRGSWRQHVITERNSSTLQKTRAEVTFNQT